MSTLSSIDPFAPDTIECPFAFYQALRREAPVYMLPRLGYFVVSRFEDIQHVVMHPEIFSSTLVGFLFDGRLVDGREHGARAVDVLAIADPPDHTRQRKLLTQAFNVRRIGRLEPDIRALADGLVDRFVGDGRADWVRQFADPLPMRVIAALLGLPREDVDDLKRWSDAGVAILSGLNTAEQLFECARLTEELLKYLRTRLDERMAAPRREDVLGELVQAIGGDEESLTEDEAVSILVQLVIAGNESTASLIASATCALLQRSDLETSLREDRSRIPAFVEEALRLESPFQGHFRLATVDTEIGGVKIPAGSRLMVLWASGNRDPGQFPSPEEADLCRTNAKEHLGFGAGIHYCLGAPLARLEGRIAIETLLDRLPGVHLAPEQTCRHMPSVFVRRLEALDILFDAAPSAS
jgi:cytochrome P450